MSVVRGPWIAINVPMPVRGPWSVDWLLALAKTVRGWLSVDHGTATTDSYYGL
jgi:hypothetical protein